MIAAETGSLISVTLKAYNCLLSCQITYSQLLLWMTEIYTRWLWACIHITGCNNITKETRGKKACENVNSSDRLVPTPLSPNIVKLNVWIILWSSLKIWFCTLQSNGKFMPKIYILYDNFSYTVFLLTLTVRRRQTERLISAKDDIILDQHCMMSFVYKAFYNHVDFLTCLLNV